jgi:hypothetical protein
MRPEPLPADDKVCPVNQRRIASASGFQCLNRGIRGKMPHNLEMVAIVLTMDHN